jgi:hypothetical protein
MNTFPRPAAAPVSGPSPLVPPVATPVHNPHAGPGTAPPPAANADLEDEEEARIKCDFYAWCAGCEGYGSIF